MSKALKESFAYCAEALQNMDDQKAISSAQISNAFLHLVVHNNEIYGNIVGYLRVSGITPPSTAARMGQQEEKLGRDVRSERDVRVHRRADDGDLVGCGDHLEVAALQRAHLHHLVQIDVQQARSRRTSNSARRYKTCPGRPDGCWWPSPPPARDARGWRTSAQRSSPCIAC